MPHVAHGIDTVDGEHMGFVVGKIRVSLDVFGHLFKGGTVFQFHIHHTAMDAFTQRNRNGKGVFHAFLATHTDAVAHRHARTEIGVRQAFRCQTLHQGANDGIRTWIPAGSDDAHGLCFLINRHQLAAIVNDGRMDVERVHGIDAQRQDLLGIFGT